MDKIVSLYDPKVMAKELAADSVDLIHHTPSLPAIKKLVVIADILELSVAIHEKFPNMIEMVWDVDAIKDLAVKRRELYLYHRVDFRPPMLYEMYDGKLLTLVRIVAVRHPSLYNAL